MNAIDQAEQLRQEALALLTAERNAINEKIAQLGGEAEQKNGRKKSCSRCGVEGHSIRTCPTPENTNA